MLEALVAVTATTGLFALAKGIRATINTGSIHGWLFHGTSEATTCPAHGVMGRLMRRTSAVRGVAVHSAEWGASPVERPANRFRV